MKSPDKFIRPLLLGVPLAFGIAAGAAAAEVAGRAFEFLRMDAGAAGIALGGAAAGRPTDAYAVFYNPALNYVSGKERFISAGLSYSAWVEGINYQDAVIGVRSGKNAYGIEYRRVDYGSIPGYDAAGTLTDAYTAGAYILGLDFSRELGRGFVAGAAAKTAAETIGDSAGRAFVFDLGLFYKPSAPELKKFTFGLALKNAGGPVRFDAENELLPMIWEAGTAYKPFAGKELVLTLDCGIPNSGKPEPRAGLEYSPVKGVFLRAGYSGSGAGSGFRAGAGAVFRDIGLDYALLPMGEFGITHHLGINIKFDTAELKKKPAPPPPPYVAPPWPADETAPYVAQKPAERPAAVEPAAPPIVVEAAATAAAPEPLVAQKPAEEPAAVPAAVEPAVPAAVEPAAPAAAPEPVVAQKPAEQPAAAPAVVEPASPAAPAPVAGLKVSGIIMSKNISGREPQETAKVFDLKVGRIYCWSALKAAPAATMIKHVWYVDGKKVLTVKLPVRPHADSPWRTWSTTKVYWGEWKVEVTDENGTVLDSVTFRVGER